MGSQPSYSITKPAILLPLSSRAPPHLEGWHSPVLTREKPFAEATSPAANMFVTLVLIRLSTMPPFISMPLPLRKSARRDSGGNKKKVRLQSLSPSSLISTPVFFHVTHQSSGR
jgi:hypothetical protein